jgi:hypothetical protein
MSLRSLEKYLYAQEGEHVAKEALPPIPGYFGLAQRLVRSVRSGLKGEAVADLGSDLEALAAGLEPEQEAEKLNEAAQIFDRIWEDFRNRLKVADQERADDFRKVLASLKETFSVLSSGTQGADLRFQKLDESLQIATKVEDLSLLRVHLAQTLQFVRQEASRERRRNRGLLDVLSEHIRHSQENISRMSGTMASRDAAISSMTLALGSKSELQVTIFVADILKRLTSVHGNGISDCLLDEFSRNTLQPIAGEGKVFRWSNTSVIMLGDKAKPADVPQSLFEYQAFLGDRVATFRVGLRSLALPLQGQVKDIAQRLDDFAHVPRLAPSTAPSPLLVSDSRPG